MYYTMISKFMPTAYCNFKLTILSCGAKLFSLKEASQSDVKATNANNALAGT